MWLHHNDSFCGWYNCCNQAVSILNNHLFEIISHGSRYQSNVIGLHTLLRAQQHEHSGQSDEYLHQLYYNEINWYCSEWDGLFCQTIPITRSTWILTIAIALVSSTSIRQSWSFPIVNAGVHKLACIIPTDNAKSNLNQPTWHLLPSNDLFKTKLWQCTCVCNLNNCSGS